MVTRCKPRRQTKKNTEDQIRPVGPGFYGVGLAGHIRVQGVSEARKGHHVPGERKSVVNDAWWLRRRYRHVPAENSLASTLPPLFETVAYGISGSRLRGIAQAVFASPPLALEISSPPWPRRIADRQFTGYRANVGFAAGIHGCYEDSRRLQCLVHRTLVRDFDDLCPWFLDEDDRPDPKRQR